MIVKICGITNRDDAQAAVDAGAHALGFNFYRQSPRYLTPENAAAIVANLPAHILTVGVFVDETAETVIDLAQQAGIAVAQLHGRTGPAPMRFWRAFPATPDWSRMLTGDSAAEAFLLDTPDAHLRGGTGRPFDWSLARSSPAMRLILAGGLDETNVAAAIEQTRPWGVDACSRLESAPGKKEHAKMRRFIQAALATDL